MILIFIGLLNFSGGPESIFLVWQKILEFLCLFLLLINLDINRIQNSTSTTNLIESSLCSLCLLENDFSFVTLTHTLIVNLFDYASTDPITEQIQVNSTQSVDERVRLSTV
jgi:hypothetical protein